MSLLDKWMMTDAEGCLPQDRLPTHLRYKPLYEKLIEGLKACPAQQYTDLLAQCAKG
jgi:hypothetical protein